MKIIAITLLVTSVLSVRAADPKALWDANCAQCHANTFLC